MLKSLFHLQSIFFNTNRRIPLTQKRILIKAFRVNTLCLLFLVISIINTKLGWRFLSSDSEIYFLHTNLLALFLFVVTSLLIFIAIIKDEATNSLMSIIFILLAIIVTFYAYGYSDFENSPYSLPFVKSSSQAVMLALKQLTDSVINLIGG